MKTFKEQFITEATDNKETIKKMRELVAMIETEINAVDNKALIEKIKEQLKEVELVKE